VDNIPRAEAAVAALEGQMFRLIDENCRIENEKTVTTAGGSIEIYITEQMKSASKNLVARKDELLPFLLRIILRFLFPGFKLSKKLVCYWFIVRKGNVQYMDGNIPTLCTKFFFILIEEILVMACDDSHVGKIQQKCVSIFSISVNESIESRIKGR